MHLAQQDAAGICPKAKTPHLATRKTHKKVSKSGCRMLLLCFGRIVHLVCTPLPIRGSPQSLYKKTETINLKVKQLKCSPSFFSSKCRQRRTHFPKCLNARPLDLPIRNLNESLTFLIAKARLETDVKPRQPGILEAFTLCLSLISTSMLCHAV